MDSVMSVDSVQFRVQADPVDEVNFRARLDQPVDEVNFRARLDQPIDEVRFQVQPGVDEVRLRGRVSSPPDVDEVRVRGHIPRKPLSYDLVWKHRLLIWLVYINSVGHFLYQGKHKSWADLRKGVENITHAKKEWETVRLKMPPLFVKWPQHFDFKESDEYNALIRGMAPQKLTYGYWYFWLDPLLKQLYGTTPLEDNRLPYVPKSTPQATPAECRAGWLCPSLPQA
jgi:hypothetical protein